MLKPGKINIPTINTRIKKTSAKTSKHFEANRKTKLNFKQKNFGKLNFHHSELVVNGIDSISEFLKLTQIRDKDQTVVVISDSKDNSDYSISQETKLNNFWNYVKVISFISAKIILLILLIVLIICLKPIEKTRKLLNLIRNRVNRNRLNITSTNPTVNYSVANDDIVLSNEEINLTRSDNVMRKKSIFTFDFEF